MFLRKWSLWDSPGQPVSNELELCSMLFLFSKVGLDLGLADATYKLL